MHSLTHTKEKPFACSCGKRFTRKSSLKVHRKDVHHSGEEEGEPRIFQNRAENISFEILQQETELKYSQQLQGDIKVQVSSLVNSFLALRNYGGKLQPSDQTVPNLYEPTEYFTTLPQDPMEQVADASASQVPFPEKSEEVAPFWELQPLFLLPGQSANLFE